MSLEWTKRNWERFGELDPLFAILSDPTKAGRRWEIDEFFASGRREVAAHLADMAARHVQVGRRRALDFGCGVGRLTQALCDHFERCDGVDIAGSMIRRARRLNQAGERCRYHVNDAAHLALFEDRSFDFVLSMIVLQHIPPAAATRYIAEFVRVLKPGGVAVFQVPAAGPPAAPASPAGPTPWYRGAGIALTRGRLRAALEGPPVMDMHCLPAPEVRAAVAEAGGTVVAVDPCQVCGEAFDSYRYFALRPPT